MVTRPHDREGLVGPTAAGCHGRRRSAPRSTGKLARLRFMIRLLQSLLILAILALPSFGAPYADPTPFPPESTPAPNIVQAKLVKRVEATYPAGSAEKSLRDDVFVAFEVDAQGRVHKARAFFS